MPLFSVIVAVQTRWFNEAMIRIYMVMVLLLLQACSEPKTPSSYVQAELEAWVHYGSDAERQMIQQQVARFNEQQDAVRINAVILPPGVYHQQIADAAKNGRLPDILELDPAYVGYHVWQGHLQAIDKLLTDSIRMDMPSSLLRQNMVRGRLYAVSPTHRAMVLYGHRSLLEQDRLDLAGLMSERWPGAKFTGLIDTQARDMVQSSGSAAVMELDVSGDGQWLVTALLSRMMAGDDDQTAFVDKLNTPASRHLLEQVQAWFVRGVVDKRDGDAFLQGQVALALASQAEYQSYKQKWENDLFSLPLWASGVSAGTSWGLSRDCRDKRIAMRFIEFLLGGKEASMMADATGMLPSRRSALMGRSALLDEGTTVFDRPMLEDGPLPPLSSPAYPALRNRFAGLIKDITGGMDEPEAVRLAMKDMTIIKGQYEQSMN